MSDNNKSYQWLPDQLESEESKELILKVSEHINYDIMKARAFAVALLTNNNDHNAASLINDVLLGTE
tara:strand:+ start:240 stop:440 length:201 start_codon:yes stop_codon:yes gene_type:complete